MSESADVVKPPDVIEEKERPEFDGMSNFEIISRMPPTQVADYVKLLGLNAEVGNTVYTGLRVPGDDNPDSLRDTLKDDYEHLPHYLLRQTVDPFETKSLKKALEQLDERSARWVRSLATAVDRSNPEAITIDEVKDLADTLLSRGFRRKRIMPVKDTDTVIAPSTYRYKDGAYLMESMSRYEIPVPQLVIDKQDKLYTALPEGVTMHTQIDLFNLIRQKDFADVQEFTGRSNQMYDYISRFTADVQDRLLDQITDLAAKGASEQFKFQPYKLTLIESEDGEYEYMFKSIDPTIHSDPTKYDDQPDPYKAIYLENISGLQVTQKGYVKLRQDMIDQLLREIPIGMADQLEDLVSSGQETFDSQSWLDSLFQLHKLYGRPQKPSTGVTPVQGKQPKTAITDTPGYRPPGQR